MFARDRLRAKGKRRRASLWLNNTLVYVVVGGVALPARIVFALPDYDPLPHLGMASREI